jgi:phosphocarrier protein
MGYRGSAVESARARVQDSKGLHLRVSAKVVQCAQKLESRIVLCHRCREANARSILQVLSLGAPFDGDVEIRATGPDEDEAVRRMAEVFNNGAGI